MFSRLRSAIVANASYRMPKAKKEAKAKERAREPGLP